MNIEHSREFSEGIKVWLSLGGIGLAVAWRFLPGRAARAMLALILAVATVNYARWGMETPLRKVDTYDLLHYYVNAKYFDELGYFDLYPALILADHEENGPYYEEGSKYMAQDERGHGMRPIEHAVARGTTVKAEKFTAETWSTFKHDALYIQRNIKGLNDDLWRQLIQDHGFNGTTVWTMIARPVATAVPVESIKWLCHIDTALLIAAAVTVGWAYGADVAMWSVLFLLLTYSGRWPTYSWSFLRYDFLAGMMIAMALLRKGRPFLAGVFSGWSATLRLFPALWLFGPGAKGFAGLAQKKVHKPLLVFLGGFALSAVVLQGLAVVEFGPEVVKVHLENMEDHNSSEQLSSRRIGLALALPYRGDTSKNIAKETKAVIEGQKPLRFAIAGVLMVALAWGLRRARDDEAYAFGFLPFFFLTTASYYYYVARITLVILHASDLRKPKHVFGLTWLLGLELFSNWAETRHPGHRVFLIGTLAWGLLIYSVVMAAWYLWDNRKAEAPAEPAPA
jgi:hypothetical protein